MNIHCLGWGTVCRFLLASVKERICVSGLLAKFTFACVFGVLESV